MNIPIPYITVEGKTYSLFGRNSSTDAYYRLIGEMADQVTSRSNDLLKVLEDLQKYSKRKRLLKRIAQTSEDTDIVSYILHLVNTSLSEYTQQVEPHLRKLPLIKYRDRRLRTTREQYHLYMLEIELTNRFNHDSFLKADHKIALLPYCLRDFDADCKAAAEDFDPQCKFCSKKCYENYITRILNEYEVTAYIWQGSGLRKLAKKVTANHQTLAVLGIACVPELTMGLRNCRKNGIAAIGIPLDANRCARWMGDFYSNSVNLEQLEKLIKNHD